jgi:hypothetical protein
MTTAKDAYAKADWSLVPEGLRLPLRDYIEHGHFPGTFLTELLSGNLFTAAALSSEQLAAGIGSVALFLIRHTPGECYGTRLHVGDWIRNGGLAGYKPGDETS